MVKYNCERTGSIVVEADSPEEAREKADESGIDKWEWENIEVEEY